MFLLIPAYPGCPGQTAVKWLSLLPGLNLRRRWSPGGKRTVDVNDEQTDGFLDEISMS